MTTTLSETSTTLAPRLATGARDPQRMRAVNNDVRRVVRTGSGGERIPFFCECPEQGCYLPLWLTLGEFDALVAGPGFGRSAGHDPAPSALTGEA